MSEYFCSWSGGADSTATVLLALEPGERVLAANGSFVGEAYMASNGAWMRHDGFPWRDGVTGRTVKYWMLLPAPPDRRPPDGL